MPDLMNLRWADAAHACLLAERDGASVAIPADAANPDYAAILEGGLDIAPFRRWRGLEEAKAALVSDVKAEASARILAVMPEWKQRNATAHGLALVRKVQLGGVLTTDEQAAEARYSAAWSAVSAIRQASDVKEGEIAALKHLDAAESYDVLTGWPE